MNGVITDPTVAPLNSTCSTIVVGLAVGGTVRGGLGGAGVSPLGGAGVGSSSREAEIAPTAMLPEVAKAILGMPWTISTTSSCVSSLRTPLAIAMSVFSWLQPGLPGIFTLTMILPAFTDACTFCTAIRAFHAYVLCTLAISSSFVSSSTLSNTTPLTRTETSHPKSSQL